MDKVRSSIRMLGAGFFQDVTGTRKVRGKTYDQSTLVADGTDLEDGNPSFMTEANDDIMDEDFVETLCQEGDEDAAMVADF